MCGFVGFMASNDSTEMQELNLRRMMASIAHRGPDSSGCWIDGNGAIAIGHQRLAILEISAHGAQPMESQDKRWVLAFNGEIYNHRDIRKYISEKGYQIKWIGDSDTETLLVAIQHFGLERSIQLCVGMFAFSLWDSVKKDLYLVRDRLGEKPLYYGWQGSGNVKTFLFGSELKAIRLHPDFVGGISQQALKTYFRYGNCAGSQSIYEGIFKLNPGSVLILENNSFIPRIYSYWSVKKSIEEGIKSRFLYSDSKIIDGLELELMRSVSSQMAADVPLGVFLSGGIDSSLIASLMQSSSSVPIKSFTIGFEQDSYNEAPYAKKIANHLGTDHSELYLGVKEATKVIFDLGKIYDEPFADSSQIPTCILSQFTKNHVSVALTGDGGDELFGGYNRYLLSGSLWGYLSHIPLSVRRGLAHGMLSIPPQLLTKALGKSIFLKKWLGSGERLHKAAYILEASSVTDLYRRQVSQIYDPESLLIASRDVVEPELIEQEFFLNLGIVEGMMANDLINYLPNDILTKVDRAAMSASLETRAPFLDHRIVEYAWKIPMTCKIRRGSEGVDTKWALKKILYKHISKGLLDRPKSGFGVPIGDWLRGPLKDWAESLLAHSRLKQEGIFDANLVRKMWENHLSCRVNLQHQLWCVLMFQLWLSEQND